MRNRLKIRSRRSPKRKNPKETLINCLSIQGVWRRAAGTAALLFCIGAVSAEPALFQYRFLWVVRDAIVAPEKVDQVIDFAAGNGFNNILVQVRGRGDAYYNSSLVPKSNLITDQSYDPLSDIILKARMKGIRVHAWVNTYLIWSSNEVPIQRDHLLFTHPEWLDSNGSGKISVPRDIRNFSSKNGNEGFYLSPHHPEVSKYLVAVFRELAAKYNLDGIHLDYVRYHNSSYGMNSEAVTTYLKKGGTLPVQEFSNLSPDYSDRQANMEWSDYRRHAITRFVRDVRKTIREVNPSCRLSAAVKPNLYQARNVFLQEWDVWLAAGYLDWAIPMNYTPDLREYALNIDVIYDHLSLRYRDRIIMGIATYNQSSLDAADKITYANVTRFQGISIFSYNSMVENPRYIQPIRDRLFPFLSKD